MYLCPQNTHTQTYSQTLPSPSSAGSHHPFCDASLALSGHTSFSFLHYRTLFTHFFSSHKYQLSTDIPPGAANTAATRPNVFSSSLLLSYTTYFTVMECFGFYACLLP